MCSLLYCPVTSSVLGPNTLLSNIFSKIVSLNSYPTLNIINVKILKTLNSSSKTNVNVTVTGASYFKHLSGTLKHACALYVQPIKTCISECPFLSRTLECVRIFSLSLKVIICQGLIPYNGWINFHFHLTMCRVD